MFILWEQWHLFFADEQQSREIWTLNSELYEVTKKSVNIPRNQRQQSIRSFLDEWKEASKIS